MAHVGSDVGHAVVVLVDAADEDFRVEAGRPQEAKTSRRPGCEHEPGSHGTFIVA